MSYLTKSYHPLGLILAVYLPVHTPPLTHAKAKRQPLKPSRKSRRTHCRKPATYVLSLPPQL
jgi:hypothetical protein